MWISSTPPGKRQKYIIMQAYTFVVYLVLRNTLLCNRAHLGWRHMCICLIIKCIGISQHVFKDVYRIAKKDFKPSKFHRLSVGSDCDKGKWRKHALNLTFSLYYKKASSLMEDTETSCYLFSAQQLIKMYFFHQSFLALLTATWFDLSCKRL